MPVVKFSVSKFYVDHRKEVAKVSGLKDHSEWAMKKVREYLLGVPFQGGTRGGFIPTYRSWEDLGELTDARSGKQVTFDYKPQPKTLPLQSGKEKEPLEALTLNAKTAEWLQLAIDFSTKLVTRFNEIKDLPTIQPQMEGRSSSVSEFLSMYLSAEMKNDIVQQDAKDLG